MLRLSRSHALFSVVLCSVSGCFSGNYDADFRASLERHRQEAAFQSLHPQPQTLAGGRLLIRAPRALTGQDETGEKPSSKPSFLRDLPGFAVAYDREVVQGDAKVIAVLAVSVPADKDSNLEELKKSILQQVQAVPAFAKAKPAWAPAEGLADAGAAWSVLSLPGPQPFVQIKEAKPATPELEGETQIWLASDPDTKTAAVLVWRVPQAAANDVAVAALAPLVARKVEFRAAAEPAAGGDAQPGQ